jgi:hypothetical protein|tara:strand:- start:91 stop:819 length:729 start_codon:yes stop_codon:yes gene_type:complete
MYPADWDKHHKKILRGIDAKPGINSTKLRRDELDAMPSKTFFKKVSELKKAGFIIEGNKIDGKGGKRIPLFLSGSAKTGFKQIQILGSLQQLMLGNSDEAQGIMKNITDDLVSWKGILARGLMLKRKDPPYLSFIFIPTLKQSSVLLEMPESYISEIPDIFGSLLNSYLIAGAQDTGIFAKKSDSLNRLLFAGGLTPKPSHEIETWIQNGYFDSLSEAFYRILEKGFLSVRSELSQLNSKSK